MNAKWLRNVLGIGVSIVFICLPGNRAFSQSSRRLRRPCISHLRPGGLASDPFCPRPRKVTDANFFFVYPNPSGDPGTACRNTHLRFVVNFKIGSRRRVLLAGLGDIGRYNGFFVPCWFSRCRFGGIRGVAHSGSGLMLAVWSECTQTEVQKERDQFGLIGIFRRLIAEKATSTADPSTRCARSG